MPQPPLLPQETLARVLRLARLDGTGSMVLGGMFALGAAAAHDFPFAAVGLLAAGAGAIELHGTALLRQGQPRGMNWLVLSQPLLLLAILIYCALRLWVVELPSIESLPGMYSNLAADFAAAAEQWGMTVREFQRALNRITAVAVAIAALGFQGGMLIYYLRRRTPVIQALHAEAEIDAQSDDS